MDLTGSLIDTNLKIYPSDKFVSYIKTIPVTKDVPQNLLRLMQSEENFTRTEEKHDKEIHKVRYTNTDIKNLNKIKDIIYSNEANIDKAQIKNSINEEQVHDENIAKNKSIADSTENETDGKGDFKEENKDKMYITTSDIDWVFVHLQERKHMMNNVPHLHQLFKGSNIVMPENRLIKRNPVLEARCVKLRAQQEAREYRKMTKGVDNVRMRFPEDSISYQIKQLNRQLIAIGQFILSIFAGFLFGFKGIEWMIGSLDFGFKLLLGVMCALIIALAEIYFLAKKLNEELTMTETVQLGGPPKFANQPDFKIPSVTTTESSEKKEHQD